MSYKVNYLSLRDQVLDIGGYVADHNMVGYCVKKKDVICIKPSLPWKLKLFVLAHECGHLYRYKDGQLLNTLQVSSEKRAHNRARAILESIDEDLIPEYVSYWNKSVDKNKVLA